MPTPLPSRRRERLLEILERDGVIQLEPAAEELAVSVMTVRRDIDRLDADGLARRVRGGAVAPVVPRAFGERASTRTLAKEAIARKALSFVPMDGAAAFDASTTSGTLLALVRPQRLLVVTNSVDNAAVTHGRSGIRTILVGGEREPQTGSLVGPTAEQVARGFSFDLFVTSASAIDSAVGTAEVSLDEAAVKQVFASRAATTVVLADSSKLGQRALVRALEWAQIDIVITELDPSDPRLDAYRSLVDLV
jgi:DeoR/GlpR family transcriptional regulator of sugar metabolism